MRVSEVRSLFLGESWVRVSEVVNYIPRVVSVKLESIRLEFF